MVGVWTRDAASEVSLAESMGAGAVLDRLEEHEESPLRVANP